MGITEMHILFRQLAQQMGMQNARTILPDQIDILINASISDTFNQIIQNHIGLTSSGTTVDNSKIGQINSLKSLYRSKVYDYTNFIIKKNGRLGIYLTSNTFAYPTDLRLILGFTIDYWNKDEKEVDGQTRISSTGEFPVRIMDDDKVGIVTNDTILRSRVTSPIIVPSDDFMMIYVDKVNIDNDNVYYFDKGLVLNNVRLIYLKEPVKVKYSTKPDECVDSDMEQQLHVDIVKYAIQLWQASLQGQLVTSQTSHRTQMTGQTNKSDNNN